MGQQGLHQEGLALRAGLHPAHLGHIGRELKSPTIDTLLKIASALQIELAKESTCCLSTGALVLWGQKCILGNKDAEKCPYSHICYCNGNITHSIPKCVLSSPWADDASSIPAAVPSVQKTLPFPIPCKWPDNDSRYVPKETSP